MSLNILGISAFYHDSAAVLLVDGEIMAAAHEERFSRKKHDSGFPEKAVRFCLEEAGLSIDQLDAVVFYDKPLMKFERLLETYMAFAPKGLKSFLSSIPVWLKEKMFLKKMIHEALEKIQPYDVKKLKLLFSEHHLSHAASAFYPSPFEEAAILTLDGVGEWATASISVGKGNRIELLKELRFPHSLGLLYSAFTYYLGFKVNSGEYKLMGLSPYGNAKSKHYREFKQLIEKELIEIKEDGSVWLNQKYFNYATGLHMVYDKKWEKLFGMKRRLPESELESVHCDMALAIQHITEEIVLKMATTAQNLTGMKNICLAGGVALNCVANGKLLKREDLFENIWIQPAAGDAGGALGAAQAVHHMYYDKPRTVFAGEDDMKGSYLGPEFSRQEVIKMARRHKAVYQELEQFKDVVEFTAHALNEEKVIGWFQGRMEWGPRSLGNRSILGDARSESMQKKLNLKIKYRESFRPFAPAVLEEQAEEFFELKASPYMLLVAPVQSSRRNSLPGNYESLPLKEKLYFVRSDIPAVTHLDYSARVQTVNAKTNPQFHALLSELKEKTGYGLVVNTSFNVRGEPIVCTPEDAYLCFMRTEMDVLVIGDFIFEKDKQPEWKESHDWREEYGLD